MKYHIENLKLPILEDVNKFYNINISNSEIYLTIKINSNIVIESLLNLIVLCYNNIVDELKICIDDSILLEKLLLLFKDRLMLILNKFDNVQIIFRIDGIDYNYLFNTNHPLDLIFDQNTDCLEEFDITKFINMNTKFIFPGALDDQYYYYLIFSIHYRSCCYQFSYSEPHAVLIICLYKNKTILVKHNKRGWELPGGKVDEGESPVNAAFRELCEETGLSFLINTDYRFENNFGFILIFSLIIGSLIPLGQYIIESNKDSNDIHIKTVYGCNLNEKFIEAYNLKESSWRETSGTLLVDFPMELFHIERLGKVSPLLKDEVFNLSQRIAMSTLN